MFQKLTSAVLQDDEGVEAARGLINEVYELVADNYLDARSGGFDPRKYVMLSLPCYVKSKADLC